MSHVTVMKGIVIQDEAALIASINELIAGGLNAEILRNTTVRGHTMSDTTRIGVCDIVLKLKGGSYDVGFKKNAKGEFEPMFDVYGNQVGSAGLAATHACEVPSGFEGQALRQLGKLSQLYAKNAALNQAAAEGYTVENCMVDPATGAVQIILNV